MLRRSQLWNQGRVLKLALALVVSVGLPGSIGRSQESKQDETLDEILKQLEALRTQVELLRNEASGTADATELTTGLLPSDWVEQFNWRPIGPANMGGRITALSVYEADPNIYWVATASGGLLKTENNGVTFDHQFDHEETVSIGDVCVAQSDPEIVWVGTGENNPRNSVSYGNGVYKSTDGGETWTNMGLEATYQTGRIVVHPTNPEIVYVGAMGRLYGPNEDRGLYKTTDGGETWEKVLYIDEETGIIDVEMHPSDPDTMIVATWQVRRDGFDSFVSTDDEVEIEDGYDSYDPIVKWGPGSGLHKTTDGGKTWTELTEGLPTSNLGRMDVDYYGKDPDVVYAIIDCEGIGKGTPPSRSYLGLRGRDSDDGVVVQTVVEKGPAAAAEIKEGDLIIAAGGEEFTKAQELVDWTLKQEVGDEVTLKIKRDEETIEAKVTIQDRPYGVVPDSGSRSSFRYSLRFFVGGDVEDVEDGDGVRVTQLFGGFNGAEAGLEADDLIVEVDGEKLIDTEQLEERIRFGKDRETFPIKVKRGDEDLELEFTLLPAEGTLTRPYFERLGGQRANIQDQQGPDAFEYGGVYRSADGGESWERINSINPRPMYFSQIRVDPSDEQNIYVLGVNLRQSTDGGKTFEGDSASRVHSDHHALWIDPNDGRHLRLGCDGGVYVSYDRADHWEHLNQSAIAQFYHVTVDTRAPYRVYGGLQDNGSWGGPSRSLEGAGPINADWFSVSFGDGFVCRVDPFDPDIVYTESQNGFMGRTNLKTGDRTSIGPNSDSEKEFQFNWENPFILSSHNPGIFYTAGNYVFRSLNRGDDLRVISPPINRTPRGTGTAVGESPLTPEILWAGTDDGNLWVTKDGGTNWENVAEKVGLPGPRWVSTIEPSRFSEGRCYVAFDAHRSDDDKPYLYVTEDFGATWKSLSDDLPRGSTRCLREDPKNEDLLLAGTEFAVWASIDRGESWTKLNNNLPTVAVHELAIQSAAGEVVAGTHGRSLWVLDLTMLRQITKETIEAKAALFEPNTVVRWRREPSRGNFGFTGSKRFIGENPPSGAQIGFVFKEAVESASIKIVNYAGTVVRVLEAPTESGFHVVRWNLQQVPPPPTEDDEESRPSGPRGPAPAGLYRVVLVAGEEEYTVDLEIKNDPTLPEGLEPPLEDLRRRSRTSEREGSEFERFGPDRS